MQQAHTSYDHESQWPAILATEGRQVHLSAGQWRHDVTEDGQGDLDLLVMRVHASHDEQMVWLFGHPPRCATPSTSCGDSWCQQALVGVSALLDAAGAAS